MGSDIHVLTHSFSWALETDRVMIIHVFHMSMWGDPEFCDANNQSILCYLQPMTNCTVSDEDIMKAYNNNTEFISPTHAHITNYTELPKYQNIKYIFTFRLYSHKVPYTVHNFLSNTKYHYDEKWYWRIQGATFITRLNERTMNWIREYEKQHCKDCKNEYDISTHIRHGDKGSEMRLIDADVYKEAIKIITSLGMKKNYTVYVNADDQESVDVIHTLPYDVASFNHTRMEYGNCTFIKNATYRFNILC